MAYEIVLAIVYSLVINAVTAQEIIGVDLFKDLGLANPAFNPQVYEDALDSVKCQEQLQYVRNNSLLRLQFIDSGLRLPRHILQGNTLDMGNYWACLDINQPLTDSTIEGKYCMLNPSSSTLIGLAEALHWNLDDIDQIHDELSKVHRNKWINPDLNVMDGVNQRTEIPDLTQIPIRMAVCIPKTCTVEEGLKGIYVNLDLFANQFSTTFCRFKNDKPWAPADYVAISLLSLIGLLTILSTGYDLWHIYYLKTDPKAINTIGRSFSVYTNGKRLTTFSKSPNNLECVDGIRAISMYWIVVGHAYTNVPAQYNLLDILEFLRSANSLWLRVANFAVDTFFLLSGILLVYTTCGKMTGTSLLKNLHLFYLNRLLRMFPLLALSILLQISILHRAADGPNWTVMAWLVNNCRKYWWSTLLYVQNFVNVDSLCIQHGWYLAIDMQLHIISPIILYWVLRGKVSAWWSLTFGVLASHTATAIYCFINDFQAWTVVGNAKPGSPTYQFYYYFNTLARAPVFFVGMYFGFLLHSWRGKKIILPKYAAVLLWLLSFGVIALLFWLVQELMRTDWDNYFVDGLINTFARSLWGMTVGWTIFACHYGYGGPINWFLSLQFWKLPSRVSYATYLFHYPIQFAIQGTALHPIFFSDAPIIYECAAQLLIFHGISVLLTLVVDSPFSVLSKLLLGGGPKKSPPKKVEDVQKTRSDDVKIS